MSLAQHRNVSYALLDAAVIAGRAEEPLIEGGWSHARLLEEAAALGGVLRHLGVEEGVPAVVDLDDPVDAVVAALAIARIGGLVTVHDDGEAPVLIAASGSRLPAAGRHRLVRGDAVTEPDLDWAVMLRAGRTDPAPCALLAEGAAYSPERSVAEQIDLLAEHPAPYDARLLRELLAV